MQYLLTEEEFKSLGKKDTDLLGKLMTELATYRELFLTTRAKYKVQDNSLGLGSKRVHIQVELDDLPTEIQQALEKGIL